ncbi:MAG TPA: hypothetical protein PKG75_11345 [Clostridiales bacterium]|nr:hypothetical protein [Clostridiales bacterium]
MISFTNTKKLKIFLEPVIRRNGRWTAGTITASIAVRLSIFGVPILTQANIKKAKGNIARNMIVN